MKIYLLRHGIAHDAAPGDSDAARELTDDGRKKLQEVMKSAKHAGVKPDVLISSPLVRAVQTAEIAAKELGVDEPLMQSDVLVPSSDPQDVWGAIRNHKSANEVMLVGHEPLLSRVVAHLLNTPALLLDFKKAGIVCIDMSEFGVQPRGVLKWILTPKLAGC